MTRPNIGPGRAIRRKVCALAELIMHCGRVNIAFAMSHPLSTLFVAIGKIGGLMLFLILVVLFVAVHGRNNDMVYVTFLFVFLVLALFSYGYWRAVNRGEGIGQYVGKQNLQHQQVSNPNYHFNNNVPDYRDHPKSKVHVVQPPKMGGVRLQIYTLNDEEAASSVGSSSTPLSGQPSPASNSGHHRHSHHHHHHSHHHGHRHHSHHHSHRPSDLTNMEQLLQNNGALSLLQSSRRLSVDCDHLPDRPMSLSVLPERQGRSCVNIPMSVMNSECSAQPPVDDQDHAIKCEVNLARSTSHYYNRQNYHYRDSEDFVEVNLPMRKKLGESISNRFAS